VPLKLLCEKFAHTRFEPSGWSGNPDIGFAKSIMDYIFRWLQLRFLTGQQQTLFDGLRPKYVNAPPPGVPDENGYGASGLSSRGGAEGSAFSSGVIPSGGAPGTGAPESRDPYIGDSQSRLGFPGGAEPRHVHTADALKELIDLGDAPTCSVCGAIMTRNGSCYRCMSCGSTSGCS
jgi:ribonucleoside-diphosphate reductase alpha chain